MPLLFPAFQPAAAPRLAPRQNCDIVPWYCYVPIAGDLNWTECREADDLKRACQAGYFPEPPAARPPEAPQTAAQLRCGAQMMVEGERDPSGPYGYCWSHHKSSVEAMNRTRQTWQGFFNALPAAPVDENEGGGSLDGWIALGLAAAGLALLMTGGRR